MAIPLPTDFGDIDGLNGNVAAFAAAIPYLAARWADWTSTEAPTTVNGWNFTPQSGPSQYVNYVLGNSHRFVQRAKDADWVYQKAKRYWNYYKRSDPGTALENLTSEQRHNLWRAGAFAGRGVGGRRVGRRGGNGRAAWGFRKRTRGGGYKRRFSNWRRTRNSFTWGSKTGRMRTRT